MLVTVKSPVQIILRCATVVHCVQHTCLDLRCNFYPEPLRVGIVKINDFCKEYDNGRAPEDCIQFKR